MPFIVAGANISINSSLWRQHNLLSLEVEDVDVHLSLVSLLFVHFALCDLPQVRVSQVMVGSEATPASSGTNLLFLAKFTCADWCWKCCLWRQTLRNYCWFCHFCINCHRKKKSVNPFTALWLMVSWFSPSQTTLEVFLLVLQQPLNILLAAY